MIVFWVDVMWLCFVAFALWVMRWVVKFAEFGCSVSVGYCSKHGCLVITFVFVDVLNLLCGWC